MSAWLQSLCDLPITIVPCHWLLDYNLKAGVALSGSGHCTQTASAHRGLAFGQQPLELLHLLFRPVSGLVGWCACCTGFQILLVPSLSYRSLPPRPHQRTNAYKEHFCLWTQSHVRTSEGLGKKRSLGSALRKPSPVEEACCILTKQYGNNTESKFSPREFRWEADLRLSSSMWNEDSLAHFHFLKQNNNQKNFFLSTYIILCAFMYFISFRQQH